MCNVMAEILLIIYTSRYHIYKTILIAKKQIYRNDSHRVYLSEERLIECLKIEKDSQRVKVPYGTKKRSCKRDLSSLVNQFIYKSPALFLFPILYSPFSIF